MRKGTNLERAFALAALASLFAGGNAVAATTFGASYVYGTSGPAAGGGALHHRQPVRAGRHGDRRRHERLGDRHELDADHGDHAGPRRRRPLRRRRRQRRRQHLHPAGRLVRQLHRRPPVQPVPRLRRGPRARRHHLGLWLRPVLLELPDHPGADGRLPAARRARPGVLPARGHGHGLRGRHPGHDLRRRLGRAALCRGHHRRLFGHAREVLPRRSRHAGPDGRVPARGLPRLGIRAAGRRRHLRRRPQRATALRSGSRSSRG